MAKKKPLSVKQRRRRRRRNLLIGEILLLGILLLVLYGYNKLQLIDHQVKDENIKINELDTQTEEVLQGYETIALFGVDNRTIGNYDIGNSDTIIIMSINNDTKEIRMSSVYRDTYLNVHDDVYNKCNSAYANGGPNAAVQMLNTNFDLDIKNYVCVDFKALADAVDAVGGLEFDITKREATEMNKFIAEQGRWIKKQSTNVGPGLQTLDGVQTLVYARIRKDSTDFRRTQRQREVVSKLMEKAKSASVIELNNMLDAILPEISTTYTNMEIIQRATSLSKYHLGDSAGFPAALATRSMGAKGDCVIPCTLVTNVSVLHQRLFDALDYVPSRTVTAISDKIKADTGYDENNAVDFGFSNPDGVDPNAQPEAAPESSGETAQ